MAEETSGDSGDSAEAAPDAATDSEGGTDAGEESGELPSADLGDATGDDGNADRSDENIASSGRSVITEGTVGIVVDDPQGVTQQITRAVGNLGGWVEGVTYQAATEYEGARGSLVVRIPSNEVGGALSSLTRYGRVETTELTRTDVTTQVRDLDARIRAMETSVERMSVFLAEARTRDDLLEAEQMLTDRQAQLEVLRTQKASLASQVSMSTLTINLWTPESAPEAKEPEPEVTGFWAGLKRGWNALYDFGSDALLVFGALLPWMVLLGLMLALVLTARVPYGRWRADRAAKRPPRPAPPRPMPLAGQPPGDPFRTQQYPQGAAPSQQHTAKQGMSPTQSAGATPPADKTTTPDNPPPA